MIVGYARVSTIDQDTALQVAALTKAACDRVFQDKVSGVSNRQALERALYTLRAGDQFVVYKVDRVARSLSDLLRVIDRITQAGATFRSLTEPIDTHTPLGRMMLQLLGSFAEFERSVIRERCTAGRLAAAARGVRWGRPRKVDVSALPGLVASGYRAGQIARMMGCDRSTVAHWLRRESLNPQRKPR